MAKRKTPGASKTADTPKKGSRTGTPLSVWIPAELRAGIGDYIAAQDTPPDLTAVVKKALEEFLTSRGFWPSTAVLQKACQVGSRNSRRTWPTAHCCGSPC